jgi:hypothetical protein
MLAIDFSTLEASGRLPKVVLRGCGLPNRLIDYLWPQVDGRLRQSISKGPPVDDRDICLLRPSVQAAYSTITARRLFALAKTRSTEAINASSRPTRTAADWRLESKRWRRTLGRLAIYHSRMLPSGPRQTGLRHSWDVRAASRTRASSISTPSPPPWSASTIPSCTLNTSGFLR